MIWLLLTGYDCGLVGSGNTESDRLFDARVLRRRQPLAGALQRLQSLAGFAARTGHLPKEQSCSGLQ